MEEMEEKKIIYDALSDQIKREDKLVSNRVSWFLASQGFLFAAAAVVINSDLESCQKIYAAKFIATFGCLISISVLIGVIGAQFSLIKLKERWDGIESDYDKFFPPPYGKNPAWLLGCIPRFCIPALLIIAWTIIFFGVRFFLFVGYLPQTNHL